MLPTLTGTWIGSTRDEAVTHVWRIVQRDDGAFIYATLDDVGTQTYYSARIVGGTILINGCDEAKFQRVDVEHFVVLRWHDECDMLFSREGLAELTAALSWTRFDGMAT